jgi:hypothetical protein
MIKGTSINYVTLYKKIRLRSLWMSPHILRNAVFLIFRTPSSIVTQNHTNSYIFNIHEFWPPPMLRNLWTIPNHHKQSKIINCNVIPLYLVSFAVICSHFKYFIRNIHGYFWISMDISIQGSAWYARKFLINAKFEIH